MEGTNKRKTGMICPFCDTDMRVTDRECIEVNHCPECGGIWLQRGALEGIIARTSASPGRERQTTNAKESGDREDDNDEDKSLIRNGRQGRSGDQEGRGGGIRDFLGNLFDFG
jgi:Zn-finger nucleic acid-binding protein